MTKEITLFKKAFFFCFLASFSCRQYPDKCTREHTVLPTSQDHPEVKNAQISIRRLQK